MNQEMLCTWLGVPKTAWPPDPWTLLGLKKNQTDLAALEERVHDRMTKLRHYQLSYPEEATEGMNRLAEAFVALTEACAKSAPAAAASTATKPANGKPVSKDETSVLNNTKLDWRNEPPPVRHPTCAAPAALPEDSLPPNPIMVAEEDKGEDTLVAKPFVAPTKPHSREIDIAHLRELAEDSDEATGNLGTIDAVIERVETTRTLLHTWEKVGKHLKAGVKKTSPKETDAFAKRLDAIADVMQLYPAYLGHPGKPGYRVVVLARLKIPLAIVRAMTPDQREDLLFDWQAGYQVLLMHRKYLRRLFKSMRKRTAVGLVVHAVRATLNDYPRLTLVGMIVGFSLAVIAGLTLCLR